MEKTNRQYLALYEYEHIYLCLHNKIGHCGIEPTPHTDHNIPKWPQLFSQSSGSVCQQLKNWQTWKSDQVHQAQLSKLILTEGNKKKM